MALRYTIRIGSSALGLKCSFETPTRGTANGVPTVPVQPRNSQPHRGLSTNILPVAPLTSRSRRDPCVRRSLVTFVSIQLLFTRFDNTVHTFVSSAPRT
jgi:hypothetical protein